MSTRLVFFLAGIILFFLFIVFSYLVHKDVFTQFDFNTTVRLQDNLSRKFDGPFSFLSEAGHFEIMTAGLVIFFVVIRQWLAGLVAFVLYGIFHVIELYSKFFVNHPPPPQFMLRTEQLVEFPQFYISAHFSYPSGHAGRTAFFSIILIIYILTRKKLSKNLKILFCSLVIVYDIAMFVSRVYLGEHWSTDVIGGTLLGSAFALITGIFMLKNPFKIKIAIPHKKE